jgi:hypothetical protein
MGQVTNSYCERLGIEVPSLAALRSRPDANTYALLIVALLQRGRPMMLGIATGSRASATCCRSDAIAVVVWSRPAREHGRSPAPR